MQLKNKPHERVPKPAFILGSVSMVAHSHNPQSPTTTFLDRFIKLAGI
jgi:coproporphyrinogen III oxidase